MPPPTEDEPGALEAARERLYRPEAPPATERSALARAARLLPHAWRGVSLPATPPQVTDRHMRAARAFFIGAAAFFALALALAGYFLYVGGNNVSVNNIVIAVQGPSTIAGGDTVPLAIAITNRNPVDIENAVFEADFPPGTRDAANVLAPLTHYTEDLGTVRSGETVTRAVKAVVFGSADTALSIPLSLSYGTKGSSATFVKKTSYPIAISSTPLSLSVDTTAETVAGKPLTLTLQVRSNATVPLDRVVVEAAYPTGFTLTSSSVPASGADIPLGTLDPGESRTITLTGILDGQDGERRTFHFSVGTAGEGAAALAVPYMTQEAAVAITAPFIETALTLNGAPLARATLAPAAAQSVMISYTNTLATALADATIAVTLSGSAVDYASIRATNGFYDSASRTVRFDKGTDVSLASLAPGASGVGAFSFSTVPAASFTAAPSVTFSVSVSGTREGQSRVPELVSASKVETIKAATAVELSAASLHAAGPFSNIGPVPPIPEQATTYTIEWRAANGGSAVAGAAVSATLPSYVEYAGTTSGAGAFSYDPKSRTVTWTIGDIAQGRAVTADFQISFIPSTSQRGQTPALTGAASFTSYDRFAGVSVRSSADPVTTETAGDPGYVPDKAVVQ